MIVTEICKLAFEANNEENDDALGGVYSGPYGIDIILAMIGTTLLIINSLALLLLVSISLVSCV